MTAQDDGSRMGGFVDPFGTLWWISTTDPGSDAA
jgi:PhnB protein